MAFPKIGSGGNINVLASGAVQAWPAMAQHFDLGGRPAAVRFAIGISLQRSRNDNDFNVRYPAVVRALGQLPDNTVIDGEIVAFDREGRSSFNALQNDDSAPAPVVYYVFDVLVLSGQDLRRESLQKRRELLEKKVLPRRPEPVRYSAPLDAELPVLIQSVKVHGF